MRLHLLGLMLLYFSFSCTLLTAEPISLPKGILKLGLYPAPQTMLDDLDGEAYILTQDKGSWVFVHFWASWCGPCREQNKLLSNLYKAHRQSGFEIVGASSDRDSASFRRVLMEDQLVWVNFLDRIDDGSVEDAYWANSVPSNVLIDRSGIIRYRNVEMEVLKETIEKLLDE